MYSLITAGGAPIPVHSGGYDVHATGKRGKRLFSRGRLRFGGELIDHRSPELELESSAARPGQLAGGLEVPAVVFDCLPDLVDAFPGGGNTWHYRRVPVSFSAEFEHLAQITHRLIDPRPIGLVDHEHVTDLQ